MGDGVARLGGKHRIGYVLEESGSRRSGSRAGSRSRSRSKTKSRFEGSMANQSMGKNSDLLPLKDVQTSSFSSQNMTKTNSNSNKILLSKQASKDGTTFFGRHSTNPFVRVS